MGSRYLCGKFLKPVTIQYLLSLNKIKEVSDPKGYFSVNTCIFIRDRGAGIRCTERCRIITSLHGTL